MHSSPDAPLRLAIGQLDSVVGDLEGNTRRILAAVSRLADDGATLVVFPELSLVGYPPLDLLDRPHWVAAALEAPELLAARLGDSAPAVIVGGIARGPHGGLWNAAFVIDGGEVTAVVGKTLLPTYDVFDEARWFEASHQLGLVMVRGHRLGVTICEDLWTGAENPWASRYSADPATALGQAGAELVVNLSASPFSQGKRRLRQDVVRAAARRAGVPVVQVNLVGGNDDLIFDGGSVVADASGALCFEAARFAEDLQMLPGQVTGPEIAVSDSGREADVAAAIELGLRDYLRKVGGRGVVLGLSGGIDSAVTAALAVRALGREHVHGLAMPSEFSSGHSLDDARELAERLGIPLHLVPIQGPLEALRDALTPVLGPAPWGLADENLQARIRGQLLMAFSNRHGPLVLATGNKSEVAVGYSTLYGDACGAIAPIGDVYKSGVYRLAHFLNREQLVIPLRTIEKPPSAELRPDQRDDQSLPPYDVLDAILEALIEDAESAALAAARLGVDLALVARIAAMIAGAEYKRRQNPIVLRVSTKAFGSGRKMPVAARMTPT